MKNRLEEIRKERGIFFCRLQLRRWLTVLPFEFLQPSQSLPLITLHRNPQSNGLLSPLATLIVKVQHSSVPAIALNQTACHFSVFHVALLSVYSRLCDNTLDGRIFQVLSALFPE